MNILKLSGVLFFSFLVSNWIFHDNNLSFEQHFALCCTCTCFYYQCCMFNIHFIKKKKMPFFAFNKLKLKIKGVKIWKLNCIRWVLKLKEHGNVTLESSVGVVQRPSQSWFHLRAGKLTKKKKLHLMCISSKFLVADYLLKFWGSRWVKRYIMI